MGVLQPATAPETAFCFQLRCSEGRTVSRGRQGHASPALLHLGRRTSGLEGSSSFCHRKQTLVLVLAVNVLNIATIHRGLISEPTIHLACVSLHVLYTVLFVSMSHKHGDHCGGCHITDSWAPVWDFSLSCPHVWARL